VNTFDGGVKSFALSVGKINVHAFFKLLKAGVAAFKIPLNHFFNGILLFPKHSHTEPLLKVVKKQRITYFVGGPLRKNQGAATAWRQIVSSRRL
jgi:hypothetical protein